MNKHKYRILPYILHTIFCTIFGRVVLYIRLCFKHLFHSDKAQAINHTSVLPRDSLYIDALHLLKYLNLRKDFLEYIIAEKNYAYNLLIDK